MENLKEIIQTITDFLDHDPSNYVPDLSNLRIYDVPLVGLASALDPLFTKLKAPEVAGPQHMTPREWLPEAQTVIAYFLPFTAAVREANREKGLPAVEWLYGRIEGEKCNELLRAFLKEKVEECGFKAVAPSIDPRFKKANRRSNWSERHAAFIAGLGTFGLNKSLITVKGCAGRYGSIIVSRKYEPTPRPYQDVYEYCTMCGECIPRCPSGAITVKGKDVNTCGDYLDNIIKLRYAPRYGCGKCQTNVPCEHSLP
jgi:epoxyqueuosine reductase